MAWQNPFTRPDTQQPQPPNRGGQQGSSQRAPTQQASQQQQSGQPQNPQFQTPTGAPAVGQGGQQQNPLDELGQQIWGAPAQPQNPQQQGQQALGGNTGGAGAPAGPAYEGYTVPWDNNQINTAMQRVDFMQGVEPQILQQLQGGDLSVLPQLLNHVGRRAYSMAAQTAHGFVDRGVKTGLDRFGGTLDDRFKEYEIKRQNPDDELISHPANKPVFEMLKNQVAKNNPNATPEQIKDISTRWFKEMAASMNSNSQQQTQNQTQNQGTNWAESLGIEDSQGNPVAGLPGSGNFDQGSGGFNNGF